MAVFQNLNAGDGKIPADKFQVETAAAILLCILEPACFLIIFALQQKRLAKQKADQIRDLLFRLAHLFVIVGNPCFCLYNFRHVLVLLTNTKPG